MSEDKPKIECVRSIYKLLEVKKKKGKLNKNERRRLRDFKKRKAEIDAIPYQPCKMCKRPTPKPMEFCSAKCRRNYKTQNFKELRNSESTVKV